MGFNDNQNKRINNFIVDELRLNPITDAIPKQVIPSIQPVFEVNKKFCTIVKQTTVTTNTNTTIYTTPTDEDFYLTSVSLDFIKDATCDMANGRVYISVVLNGATVELIPLSALTLTAQGARATLNYDPPIKIDRGTTIVNARSGAYTAGTMLRSSAITGYTQKTGDVTP